MARFVETGLEGVILVEPEVHRDERGFLLETYHAAAYRDGGIPETFVQDNHSRSAKGTLRGLHGQFPRAQGKLVRAVEGEIYDVAVDVRRGSPTFGRFYAATLSADNFCQLYIPPGMVHGFCVTSDVAQVEYKCTGFYYREDEFGIAWDDPDIGIPWPVERPTLSEKDRRAPVLRDAEAYLVDYRSG